MIGSTNFGKIHTFKGSNLLLDRKSLYIAKVVLLTAMIAIHTEHNLYCKEKEKTEEELIVDFKKAFFSVMNLRQQYKPKFLKIFEDKTNQTSPDRFIEILKNLQNKEFVSQLQTDELDNFRILLSKIELLNEEFQEEATLIIKKFLVLDEYNQFNEKLKKDEKFRKKFENVEIE